MADLHKQNAPWEDHIVEDTDALSLDMQIQIIQGSIAELGQKRYTAMLNAKIFKDAQAEADASRATEGISTLRRQLADIRRRQEGRIRAETQRVLDEADAARAALADANDAVRDAEAQLNIARDSAND